MDLNQWKQAMQIHTAALKLLLETVLQESYSIELESMESGSNEDAQKQMTQAGIVVRFVEKNFQSEVFLGFSEQWMTALASQLLSAKTPKEKISKELVVEFSIHLMDMITGSLAEVGVEVEVASIDTIASSKLSKAFNLQQYFRTNILAEPENGGKPLSLLVALSHPDKEQLAIYEQKFEDKNPFVDDHYSEIAKRFACHVDMAQDRNGRNSYGSGVTMKGQQVEFEDFGKSQQVKNTREVRNIDILKDVEIGLSVELGRRQMSLGNILQLVKGSVIELEKLAGEPVEILVNGHKIAQGDVVVIDEHFGVRITHLLASQERIKELQ